jgi:NAD-dependent SIR2 family protein deacetylase
MNPAHIEDAAALIREADGLLVTAGAGMGVDSGLPDFRSNNGFWKTYPALSKAGMSFEAIASPYAFHRDARLAWGFYGHRLKLYRDTVPHAGFRILQAIGARLEHGLFVSTSNVDGHFQKSGIAADRIHEMHGSIHHLQCLDPHCSIAVWDAARFAPEIDEAACRLTNDLPACRYCGGLARPNILMFGDWDWRQVRAKHQAQKLNTWLASVERLAVIEIGAGVDVPTVRLFSDQHERLIRINPRAPQVFGPRAVGLPLGGLAALDAIGARLLADQFGGHTLWPK